MDFLMPDASQHNVLSLPILSGMASSVISAAGVKNAMPARLQRSNATSVPPSSKEPPQTDASAVSTSILLAPSQSQRTRPTSSQL